MKSADQLTKTDVVRVVQNNVDPEARIEFEDLTVVSFAAIVISETFQGMSESDRQAIVWDAIREEFDYAAFEPLALILTITPAQFDAIGTEDDTVFDQPLVGPERAG